MVNVGGQSSGRIRETTTKNIKECSPAGPGSKCEFQLNIPGIFFAYYGIEKQPKMNLFLIYHYCTYFRQ